jgi:hypothetical protein
MIIEPLAFLRLDFAHCAATYAATLRRPLLTSEVRNFTMGALDWYGKIEVMINP